LVKDNFSSARLVTLPEEKKALWTNVWPRLKKKVFDVRGIFFLTREILAGNLLGSVSLKGFFTHAKGSENFVA